MGNFIDDEFDKAQREWEEEEARQRELEEEEERNESDLQYIAEQVKKMSCRNLGGRYNINVSDYDGEDYLIWE